MTLKPEVVSAAEELEPKVLIPTIAVCKSPIVPRALSTTGLPVEMTLVEAADAAGATELATVGWLTPGAAGLPPPEQPPSNRLSARKVGTQFETLR